MLLSIPYRYPFQYSWDIMYRKLRNYRGIENTRTACMHVPRRHTWKTHLSCVAQLMVTRKMNKNGLFRFRHSKIYPWFVRNVGNGDVALYVEQWQKHMGVQKNTSSATDFLKNSGQIAHFYIFLKSLMKLPMIFKLNIEYQPQVLCNSWCSVTCPWLEILQTQSFLRKSGWLEYFNFPQDNSFILCYIQG